MMEEDHRDKWLFFSGTGAKRDDEGKGYRRKGMEEEQEQGQREYQTVVQNWKFLREEEKRRGINGVRKGREVVEEEHDEK